jgi:UDP-N-acetylmuramate dehydrogenase
MYFCGAIFISAKIIRVEHFIARFNVKERVCLKSFTTLRAGGPAELFVCVHDVDLLAEIALFAQRHNVRTTYLGSGSNVLPSDAGVSGLVVQNACAKIDFLSSQEVVADAGCSLQELFLKTAQKGLGGLQHAVGIPGTLGGALVSNAGAYRGNVSKYLASLEIIYQGERQWVSPEWMQFEYRDSILRSVNPPACLLLRAKFSFPVENTKDIYHQAKDFQRQRIFKQPPCASAGSFFKNVNSLDLAKSLTDLPDPLQRAGVVPAGFLLMKVGLGGYELNGAQFSRRHTNFILNVNAASASAIRSLAELGKQKVYEQFGVELEEEVLYIGDWSQFLR